MEGMSRVLSRSSEDVAAFSSKVDDNGDQFTESQNCSASSPLGLFHCLPLELDWDDSGAGLTCPFSRAADCVPKDMEDVLSAALTSHSLTPLLKEELRCKIQLRRLQHGEEEMTADFSTKHSAMSLEEVAKKNKKMYQNRISAQRSRDRQKCLEKSIKSRLELLQNENKLLLEQAQSLRSACRMARDWLQQHRNCLQHTSTPSRPDPSALPQSNVESSPALPVSGIMPSPHLSLSSLLSSSALPLTDMSSASHLSLSSLLSSSALSLTDMTSSSHPPLSIVESSSVPPALTGSASSTNSASSAHFDAASPVLASVLAPLGGKKSSGENQV